MRATISHWYSVGVSVPVFSGKPWHVAHDIGRFSVHFMSERLVPRVETVRTFGRIDFEFMIEPYVLSVDAVVRIVSARRETVLVEISYYINGGPREIVDHLGLFCRERFKVTADGLPFNDWIGSLVPQGVGLGLAADVLQVVTFHDSRKDDFLRGGEVTPLASSLVSRTWNMESSGTRVAVPRELNRESDRCLVHGRGVVVSCGHDDATISSVLLVLVELLFATADVRRLRRSLDAELVGPNLLGNGASGRDSASIDRLREIILTVRNARLTMVADISPILAGADSPDRVLDSIRESFAAALRVEGLVASTMTMLDTMSQIIETSVSEHEMNSMLRVEQRQRQWQFIVGSASGVVVPFALLLAYFGITTGDVSVKSSMWDASMYWPQWLATGVAVIGLLAVCIVRYRRYRKDF